MTNPIKRLFGCCCPTSIKETKQRKVSRKSFDRAIGNIHRRDKTIDIMTLQKFVHWDEASINQYMKNRKE